MADLHHVAYGWFNPVVSYLLAFLGSLLGIACTARARHARVPLRRLRWIALAALSTGGVAIWLMHFMAMLGFDVPASQVRYEPWLTAGSLLVAVGLVGLGLAVAGGPAGGSRAAAARILAGGVLVGAGATGMHYTGLAALRVGGVVSFDRNLVIASAAVAVTGSTLALALAVGRRGWALVAGAAILAAGVVGMHYTGMAALRVRLDPGTPPVDGLSPLVLVVPITVLTAAALVGMAFSALQAITQEEFAGAAIYPPAAAGRG